MAPLYNFLIVAIVHMIASSMWLNPCSVPIDQRRDCGYPGIEPGTCTTFGKASLVTRDPMMFSRLMMIAGSVFLSVLLMFKKSGFPSPVVVAYIGIGLLTVYNATRCFHDSTVPYGPHCYF
jgi:hypothetical protein